MSGALGPRNAEVRRLRALLREPEVRRSERRFILEGPRPIMGALDRAADIETLFVGPGATDAFSPLVDRARKSGAAIERIKGEAIERISTTRSPQPVFAVALMPETVESPADLDPSGTLVVTIAINDPGNLGTILRSAEASGAIAVMSCGSAVDPFNPKVVRSSAGAIFGIPVLEVDDPVRALKSLSPNWQRFGAYADAEVRYDSLPLAGGCAVVFGNEAHGISPDLDPFIDQRMTIPLLGLAESLNVAMAASVVCFEAARQRTLKS